MAYETTVPARFIETPLGWMRAAARTGAVCALTFVDDGQTIDDAVRAAGDDERALDHLCAQLDGYFRGERRIFDVPLSPRGTEFQQSVWNALCAIPYGETISYGRLAEKIGRPDAARAVAGACGANPIPIVIPCHRVVGADGSLTGFSAGLDRKRGLLELERTGVVGQSTPDQADAGLFAAAAAG